MLFITDESALGALPLVVEAAEAFDVRQGPLAGRRDDHRYARPAVCPAWSSGSPLDDMTLAAHQLFSIVVSRATRTVCVRVDRNAES